MALEAARVAKRRVSDAITDVYFATTTPAYLDKTNATAIHAALDLDRSVFAGDMIGSVRSAAGAWRSAIDAAACGRISLITFADIRTGMPGGVDERNGGDAGSALILGSGAAVIAEVLGVGSATREFLDRWRLPSEPSSRVWEERFGEEMYVPLAEAAVADACKAAGLAPDQFDHVVVGGLHSRAVKATAKALGVAAATAGDFTHVIGNSGIAHPALVLGDVLDRAEPNQYILLVTLADGGDAIVLRTTPALVAYQTSTEPSRTVANQVSHGREVSYATFLSWNGHLVREPPRREDPSRPMAPPAMRREAWKFALVGSRCRSCGSRNLPPQRVCFHCQAADEMDPAPVADVVGTVSTFTIDRLAYSPSPPTVAAIVDFDGGGRCQCEITDVDENDVVLGTRVEMTFRRLYTAGAIHDYFWKAKPVVA